MTDVPFDILQFLVDHPWIVWIWLGATVVAVGLRAAYPETEERPRWIRALLAIVDLLQINLSGPAKLISAAGKKNAASAASADGTDPLNVGTPKP